MKLWIDEDLSPILVDAAWSRGWEGTCNRDRDMLGASDADVASAAIGEDFVLVTDNRRDFRKLFEPADNVHPGLIFIPGGGPREKQRQLLNDVLDWIAAEAAARETDMDSVMVNKLVDMDRDTGKITHRVAAGRPRRLDAIAPRPRGGTAHSLSQRTRKLEADRYRFSRKAIAIEREADDFVGLASLLVIALRTPIPLPVRQDRSRQSEKACTRCGIVQPLEECFNREPRARDGHRSACKRCQRAASRERCRDKRSRPRSAVPQQLR